MEQKTKLELAFIKGWRESTGAESPKWSIIDEEIKKCTTEEEAYLRGLDYVNSLDEVIL